MKTTPLHKICVDKSDYLAAQAERKLTADLTKDVFRREYQEQLKNAPAK